MNTRLVVVAVSSFVLGFAVAVGTTCRQTTTAIDTPASGLDHDADVAVALKDLRAAIEQLPGAVRDQIRGEIAVPTRQAAGGVDVDAARLAAAIDRLEKLIEQTGSSQAARSGRGGTESWKGPGYPSLTELVRAAEQEYSHGTSVDEKLTTDHLLWSREDVLERYGPPSGIETGNGYGLVYKQATFESAKERCWLQFYTQEGWVTQVGLNCKDIR